ncbi:hypothetical protein JQ557_27885 [Bradyrhizobium sp. U87765 SZCCT0131]|uniref:hypothetical protein n=1 Tax=unclassified Bradyrhizobium TaxID=2631580 RepID=UPI001BA48B28|nr:MULTISPECIES: hypothetical protein [unclassified Bradyrhizobium]MBR1221853.1 hypothetical protein [Bradyrhizobium sp. U87765 SZCCT0131]MBR1263949.1 hypothetical protein [Bradyrhizobium sp. U87765 SZCCT0134]MBR1308268.1 hypothetical protein [Bradyrhizobium sp. U87765 SZCCT0110]MBR1320199.1 hypothetical protein [Bradyrhizobium sp. U87765 SZCCT0109]MBR1348688.1 hypothetical protein [Bradyrhizobium sp. U87765 SZCCT0048]
MLSAMKHAAPHITASRIEDIRRRVTGCALAGHDGAIRIISAPPHAFAELTSINLGEVAVGDDGLVRLAVWSASSCCTTLLGTRRATLLLPDGDDEWEVRCLVVASASLSTRRPLSGFLLKPMALFERRATSDRLSGRASEDDHNRTDNTLVALFEAFPVAHDGKNTPLQSLPP